MPPNSNLYDKWYKNFNRLMPRFLRNADADEKVIQLLEEAKGLLRENIRRSKQTKIPE